MDQLVTLSVSQSLCPHARLSVYSPICLSVVLSICPSIHPSVRPSVCPSVSSPFCLSVSPPSVSQSVSQSVITLHFMNSILSNERTVCVRKGISRCRRELLKLRGHLTSLSFLFLSTSFFSAMACFRSCSFLLFSFSC